MAVGFGEFMVVLTILVCLETCLTKYLAYKAEIKELELKIRKNEIKHLEETLYKDE